ncbi:MAG TPA: hypothetical protein VFN09_12815 [Rhodanobacteraceae bacterium]|nr:hypothetical protein [Rhodanobacteraceae bacterium]
MVPDAAKLVALIVLLYGSTSVRLLYADEAVLWLARRGFRLRLATGFLRVGGRSPLLLNPLDPLTPAYRGHWGGPTSTAGAGTAMTQHREACRRLAPLVAVVAVLVLLALPLALLFGSPLAVLACAGLAYLAAGLSLLGLWRARQAFALSPRGFAKLAFENLVCLPFAPGLIRQLCAAAPWPGDLGNAVAAWPEPARQAALATLCQGIDAQHALYDEEHPRAGDLRAYRDRLTQRSAPPATLSLSTERTTP